MKIRRTTRSVAETEALGRAAAALARPGDVLALTGELGAGKTTFIRGFAAGLGADPREVTSPTFIISQEYSIPDHDITIVHIDAYRLQSPDELNTIGWDELLADDRAVVAIEWADRIASALPRLRTVRIAIEHLADSRAIHFDIPDILAERWVAIRPRSQPCRTCRRPVAIDDPHFPFCSDRCRLIDLGEWFDESYRISRPVEASDPDDLRPDS